MSQAMRGVVIGLVTDVDDPQGLGRIRVEFPWLGEGFKSNWARIANTLAGAERGTWFLPEVGDEALLAFEMDDFRRPYVLGFLWNGVDAPPSTEPSERIIKTVSGHKLTFNDASGSESITVEDGSGVNKIVLDKDGIRIETTKDFSVTANKVVVEAKTTLELKATAKLSAKGNPVHLNP
jgi:uncharacterized protein involved in type VI secretion and phage assembly